ncbi:hypothetical protein Syun_007493 [Stephania yunnanensis]|uniref:Uncharacterized protein n=1 Tax=Stephania yunnanensis TaxID=152371 RepID=A0AAP0PYK2_9MAGN
MARRIADIEEFEFKIFGENHNQGVSSPPSCFLPFIVSIGVGGRLLFFTGLDSHLC